MPMPSPTTPVLSLLTERPPYQGQLLLHEFFQRSASEWPDRIAIDVPPSLARPQRRLVTYRELKERAETLAVHLRGLVHGECVIAILLPRDAEHLYVAQLAVLLSGAAYTCLDPMFPDGQVEHIMADARPVMVLTDAAGAERLVRVQAAVPVLDVVAWQPECGGNADLPPPPWLAPASLAYVIYTSGTTGRPKGVMIEHRAIANLVDFDRRTLGIAPEDRVGQSSSAAFDASIEEIWFAFAAGATLVVMDNDTVRLGPDLVAWLRDERITLFDPPPTLLRSIGCDDPEQALPELKRLHVGGEALPADVAERWARGRFLLNDYGPTEATVTALRGRIVPGMPVTIGRPVAGLRAWVLDGNLEEVADGVQGELCLGGVGLARGYMNDPALTARKFIQHPRLGRIYRTGDLVHRAADGNFFCHGRIDAQVKIRGYRIELEAIESQLAASPTVRAAACCVQGEGPQQRLVAFVVPVDPAAPPAEATLKELLSRSLPPYMVPARIGIVAELPASVSGKLDRRALPLLEVLGPDAAWIAPRHPLETKLAAAFGEVLETADLSVEHDFFNDLGGNSLLAARLISRLRDDPATAPLTVRDVYEARTVAGLARRVRPTQPLTPNAPRSVRRAGRPFLATLAQTAWLAGLLMLTAPLAYVAAFRVLPWLLDDCGLVALLFLTPVLYAAAMVGYTALTVVLAVLVKKLLIGRYRPTRAPIWGSYYVRHWIVQHTAKLVPWALLQGTGLHAAALRALGATIGRRVHIHRGVDLRQGGWDLLTIGDDVTLSQDAAIRLVELEDGELVVGPVILGNGSTLDVRAGMASGTCLEAGAYLAALSHLSRGGRIPRSERWDGIPAQPAGLAPLRLKPTVEPNDLSPLAQALALMLGRLALALFVALPAEAIMLVAALGEHITNADASAWLAQPTLDGQGLLLGAVLVGLATPLTLLFQALAMRLLGPVRPGVISRWSLAYVRVWLKTGLVASASRWLSGTLLWPVWLRVAGMRIGRDCEISTIIDTLPELVEIGPETFFADGIYLGGPRLHQGMVTLAPVKLGRNTFLGNHAVIPAGQTLPDDILVGISTCADDRQIRPGTSWFGQPPFELPRREVVECDRSLTHAPSWPRYLSRVAWELVRFLLPLPPLVLVWTWFTLLATAEETVSLPTLLFGVVPLLDLGIVAALCLLVVGLKWLLLGRVRPGTHPLWSCWCARWDFLYIVWDLYASGPLSALEGTLLLNWYLRAMGARIGRRVALGAGFAHVVDPDLLTFADGATVTCLFQAHTFEDRVLKIDHVVIQRDATVGANSVLLYGADIGARATVGAHSVVMKRERLLADHAYAGCPTRPIPSVAATSVT